MLTGSDLPNHDIRQRVGGGVRLKAAHILRERLDGDHDAVPTDDPRQRYRHHPYVRSDIDRSTSSTGQLAKRATLRVLEAARRYRREPQDLPIAERHEGSIGADRDERGRRWREHGFQDADGDEALSTPDRRSPEVDADRQRHRYADRLFRGPHVSIGFLSGTLGRPDVGAGGTSGRSVPIFRNARRA